MCGIVFGFFVVFVVFMVFILFVNVFMHICRDIRHNKAWTNMMQFFAQNIQTVEYHVIKMQKVQWFVNNKSAIGMYSTFTRNTAVLSILAFRASLVVPVKRVGSEAHSAHVHGRILAATWRRKLWNETRQNANRCLVRFWRDRSYIVLTPVTWGRHVPHSFFAILTQMYFCARIFGFIAKQRTDRVVVSIREAYRRVAGRDTSECPVSGWKRIHAPSIFTSIHLWTKRALT